MPDPVLRIPVDDEAFKRYMEAFQRYQDQLNEQPDMWGDVNEAVLNTAASNLTLADAIGQSVAAAIRLGDVEERNAQRRRKSAEDENAEQQRASAWRKTALGHIQEWSRTSEKIVRGFGEFASGARGAGGLFGMVADAGKGIGGPFGSLLSLAGHTLNAGYEINNAVSDKGLFARGIGASISEQEGFHNNLGRFTNTDRLIDTVMQSRGNAANWADASVLGVKSFFNSNASNAQVSADILRKQIEVYNRYTKGNVTNWQQVQAHGGLSYGTTAEDLNRLARSSNVDKAIQDALSFKSPLGDKQTDAATKSAVATDNLTTKIVDATQALTVGFINKGLDPATAGLQKLANIAEKIVSYFPSWFGGPGAKAGTKSSGSWLGGLIRWHSGDDPAANAAGSALGGGGNKGTNYTRSSDLRSFGAIAEYLKKSGLSDTAAMGAAAGAIAESHGDPNAYNKSSGAFGIGQWLGARKKALLAMAKREGKDPHDAALQLKFLAWELKGGDYGGKRVLEAKSVEAALDAYVRKFMRPAQGEETTGDLRRGRNILNAANVSVNVKVSAPPGHQTAVTTNSAARG